MFTDSLGWRYLSLYLFYVIIFCLVSAEVSGELRRISLVVPTRPRLRIRVRQIFIACNIFGTTILRVGGYSKLGRDA